MRASLQAISNVLKSSRVPKAILQQPFDHDPEHYKRLCHLERNRPSPADLIDYALDMTYMELQPDLLRHLMPVLLEAWRQDLFEGESANFGGFVEYFWPALLREKLFTAVSRTQSAGKSCSSCGIRFWTGSTLRTRLPFQERGLLPIGGFTRWFPSEWFLLILSRFGPSGGR